MFARLVALFVIVPVVELSLLFRLHEWTGNIVYTIGLILFTGFLGAWLAKQQGLSTLTRIQQAMAEGRMPASELVDGGMILFAGALLLTPGILTDAFGFSLLFPPCRAVYRRLLKRYLPKPNVQFHVGGHNGGQGGGPGSSSGQHDYDPSVVEGTAEPSSDSES